MTGKFTEKYPWLPYAAAILLFIVVSMLYFAPQFRGEVLDMHDVNAYVLSSGDIERHVQQYGEDPQWTGNSFSGMPSYMINFKVHSLLIRKLSKLPVNIMGEPAILILTAMLFFWLMLLLMRVNPWVGIIPSLAYGLSTYTILIIGAGHINKVWALAYVPLLVGAIWYTFRAKEWRKLLFGGSLAALAASLEISANHPQITYYFLLVVVALAVNELVRAVRGKALRQWGKAVGVLAIAAALAVASNTGTLYYTAQHSGDTMRGGSELAAGGDDQATRRGLDLEYATTWSYGRTESFNMFIPNLMGGASDRGFSKDGEVAQTLRRYGQPGLATRLPGYWGDQPGTAGPTYIGAVMFFLAVLALFTLDGRKKWWLFAVSVFALFLSWGSNMMWFTRLMFSILPMYNKFRAVSTALVIVQWSIPVLSALILMQMWKAKLSRDKVMYGVKWSLGITGGVALFFALFGGALFDFSSPADNMMGLPQDIIDAMRNERASMLRGDAWRSLLLVMFSAGVVVALTYDKIKKGTMVALFSVLVLVDMMPVDMRYLSWGDFVPKRKTEIVPTAADLQIMADPEPGFRVADLSANMFSDARASYFHRSVGGYHGAKLQRYQDLIERHLSNVGSPVYNMLNTKYFIYPDQQGNTHAVENDQSNGPAWFVESVRLADTPDQEITILGEIDNKHQAVADRRFAEAVRAAGVAAEQAGEITLVDYKVNHLTYEYHTSQDAVAVFSEIYYDKGWTAYIDGQQAPYFRADYVLRAMVLPAGEHTVEFRFRAPNFGAVSAVTFIFSLLILLGFAAAVVLMYMDSRKKKLNFENK